MHVKLLVLAAAVAAAFLSLDSQRDVRVLEIREGDVELTPVDGSAGPGSVAFDANGEGPYIGMSTGGSWLPQVRRWAEHSSAPQLNHNGQDPQMLAQERNGSLWIGSVLFAFFLGFTACRSIYIGG